jgi:hypothetical protein
MMRPNKLEGLPLETLSSQALEFEGKVRGNPTQLEDLSDASFLAKLLALPANVRLDWKVMARYKHSSLFGLVISYEEKSFITLTPDGTRNVVSSTAARIPEIRDHILKVTRGRNVLISQ